MFNNKILDNNDEMNLKEFNNQILSLDSNIIDKENKWSKTLEIDIIIFKEFKNNKKILSKSKFRNISKCVLLDSTGKIFEHSHIIFFT